VVRQFEDIVKIAGTAGEFVAACRRAAACPNRVGVRRGLKVASWNSWESIVEKLEAHVLEIINRSRSLATDAA
jgi:hypothetical protein